MSTLIHPSSVVSSKAHLGENVIIGPFCVVEDAAVIGDGTKLISHAVIGEHTTLGSDCTVFPHASVGLAPQDLKYAGEPTTAFVGDRTVIRECVTINRGTTALGTTVVGSDCLLMAYAHVAHDCIVGNNVILANSVNLAGHVEVHDWAIVGGVCGVHQFVRVGKHSMIGGVSRLLQDVPPYTLSGRIPQVVESLNLVGMRRRGFSEEQIDAIADFYEALYRRGRNNSDAIQAYEAEFENAIDPLVGEIIDFIRTSKRGISKSAYTRS